MVTENQHLLTVEGFGDSAGEIAVNARSFGSSKLAAAVAGLTFLVAGSALVLRPGRDSQGVAFDHTMNKAAMPSDYFEFEDRFGALLAGRANAEIQTIADCVRGGVCPDSPETDEMETLQSWLAAASAEDRANHESAADDMLQVVSGSAVLEARREVEEADAYARARVEAEEKARLEAEEAEARSIAEAEEKAHREAGEAQARAKAEAEENARREAEEVEARAMAEAEEKARRDADEAEARAFAEAEENARRETEEAEAKARVDAEEKARREAEEAEARAIAEAEEKAHREAEEAEARAKAEAEAQRRRAAEELEARARAEAEEKARSEAEEAEEASVDDVAAGEAAWAGSENEILDVPAVSGDAGSAAGALGTSLFCFMIVLADSGDPGLQEVAQSRHAGIFDCDSNAVYPGVRTSTYDTPDGQFAANADMFANIWVQFGADGLYKNYDWTVKADPDTVFIPQRLRERLQGLGVNANEAVYVKNTGLVPWGFLGPIEVLSKAAVDQLTARIASDCRAGASEGEDGWLNDCLENKIGIPARVDTNLLYSGGQVDACGDATFVAYHFYKDPGSWGSCLDRMR